MQVYLLRGERLVPVARTGRTVADALVHLSAGPGPLDIAAGLSSALPPQPLNLADTQEPDAVVIEASSEFATLSGRGQLLAVAQLVWTSTDVCCATRVRVLLDGHPAALPTDTGLAESPVGRDDYRSVAPE